MPLPLLPIIGALAQFAPQIAKWMDAGKTVQEVAETASVIAKSVTGKGNTEDAIAAMQADPQMILDYQKAIMNQDAIYEQGYLADKADARKRAAILDSTPHGNVRANWLVAVAIIIILLSLTLIIFNKDLSEFAQGALSMVLGMFLNELKNIYSFEFGTTRRSRAKSDVLDNKTE